MFNINLSSPELLIPLFVTIVSAIGVIYFLQKDWRKFGILYIISTFVGSTLCYIFVNFGFYSFPNRLFPNLSIMPITSVSLFFPLLIIIGVRYSPDAWKWKIPFYWVIVHIGMLAETLAVNLTNLIEYNYHWDVWDSYTWWWIYVLVFEWIGGLIIPDHLRKPLNSNNLHYAKLGWAILHFILITTIFLGGYYVGILTN